MLTERADKSEATVDAVNRRGRPVRLQVACSLLRGEDGTVYGVILIMDRLNQVDHEDQMDHEEDLDSGAALTP
jgi:hypothetical protein